MVLLYALSRGEREFKKSCSVNRTRHRALRGAPTSLEGDER